MTVFDVFQETPYKFLKINRGEVFGNTITDEVNLMGIFKQRENQETMSNMELNISSATLHAHPEDFTDFSNLVGQGIEVDGTDYEITNMTRGTNFDNGQVEHLTFTLQRASFIDGRTPNNDN